MANRAKRMLLSPLTTKCWYKYCYSYYYSTSTEAAAAASIGGQVVVVGGGVRQLTPPRRLSAVIIRAEAASVQNTLDEWQRGKERITRNDIIVTINHLRKSKKYFHALQLHEWMGKGELRMTNVDRAIHIDLLAKTEGVSSGEEYFNCLEESEKTNRTYGSLLSCYCREKMTNKATELFEKMKKLGFTSALNYNNMMSMYLKVGEPEKVVLLDKEREEMNIAADTYSYNQLISSYASMKDFDAVDGVLEKMRAEKVKPNGFTLGNIAAIYISAGLIDKALSALKELEDRNKIVPGLEDFQTLIRLYAQINNPEGVNRVWEGLRKNIQKPRNESYLVTLLALFKLKDEDGLEECFREWESNCSFYDIRLANVMFQSYLNRHMIDEANAHYESVIARGVVPKFRTLDMFINYHLKNQKMDLALKFLEMGASKVSSKMVRWFPNDENVSMIMKLIEDEKDEEIAKKFYQIMKQIGHFGFDSPIGRNLEKIISK